jgi:hypothetical protein
VEIASPVLVSMDERSSTENLRCAQLKVLLDLGLGVEIASLVLVSMDERSSVVRWTSPRKDVCGSRCLLGGDATPPPPLFGFGEVRICCIRVHQLKGQFSRYV